MKINFTLFKDILKEKIGDQNMYSQGRVYLLWFLTTYFLVLCLIVFKSVFKKITFDISDIKYVIDCLQWAIFLFFGYVFGGKSLDTVHKVMNKTTNAVLPSITPIVNSAPTATSSVVNSDNGDNIIIKEPDNV